MAMVGTFSKDGSERLVYKGVELPCELPPFNGRVRVWKEEPEDPCVDDNVELTDYEQACQRQRAVFEEEGIYRNNFFFLKIALAKKRKEVCGPLRKAWEESAGANWDGRRDSPEWQALWNAKAPIVKAQRANRRRWDKLERLYKKELKEISKIVNRLGKPVMEAKRKERERLAEIDRRQRAELKVNPAIREAITRMQYMNKAEYTEFFERDAEQVRAQLGYPRRWAWTYMRQRIAQHEKAMAKWRAAGLPYGEWDD